MRRAFDIHVAKGFHELSPKWIDGILHSLPPLHTLVTLPMLMNSMATKEEWDNYEWRTVEESFTYTTQFIK